MRAASKGSSGKDCRPASNIRATNEVVFHTSTKITDQRAIFGEPVIGKYLQVLFIHTIVFVEISIKPCAGHQDFIDGDIPSGAAGSDGSASHLSKFMVSRRPWLVFSPTLPSSTSPSSHSQW